MVILVPRATIVATVVILIPHLHAVLNVAVMYVQTVLLNQICTVLLAVATIVVIMNQ